jgi:acyl carrier protein
MKEIEKRIREFAEENLSFSENAADLPGHASFLRNGIIDSLGVVELVAFARQEFGLQVSTAEVTPANCDSIDRLATFIRGKMPREEPCVSS